MLNSNELLIKHVGDTYVYTYISLIREYGSTLYVGMVRVVSFSPYIGIGAKFRIRLKIAKTRLCRVEYRTNML